MPALGPRFSQSRLDFPSSQTRFYSLIRECWDTPETTNSALPFPPWSIFPFFIFFLIMIALHRQPSDLVSFTTTRISVRRNQPTRLLIVSHASQLTRGRDTIKDLSTTGRDPGRTDLFPPLPRSLAFSTFSLPEPPHRFLFPTTTLHLHHRISFIRTAACVASGQILDEGYYSEGGRK